MAEYRTVKMSFWTDPYVENLTAEGKLLYLYLFTCPYTNNLGVMETTARRIAYETGLDAGKVKELLGSMERCGKIAIDGNCILLKHFIRHQCSTSPKIIASLQALFGSVTSSVVRDALCRHYPKIFNADDMVSIPYEYHSDSHDIPSGELEFKGEGEVKRESEDLEMSNDISPGSVEPGDGDGKDDDLKCPQTELYALYEEMLPELPKLPELRESTKRNVRARWKEKLKKGKFSTKDGGIVYFRGLFAYIKTVDWVMGRSGRSTWRCDYDWIMQAKHFDRITSGYYERPTI